MLKEIMMTVLFSAGLTIPAVGFANTAVKAKDTTLGDRVESGYEKTKKVTKDIYEDTKDGTKKAYRKAKDEVCEMVNGKMECVAKKVTNKAKNTYDKAKNKTHEMN